jgi:hypothetical protein
MSPIMSWQTPIASCTRQPSPILPFGQEFCLTNPFKVFKYYFVGNIQQYEGGPPMATSSTK